MFFAYGSSNKKGVAILIKKGTDIQVKQSVIDPSGRFIILETEINNKRIILVNVYAPKKDAQAVRFFRRLNSVMKEYNFTEEGKCNYWWGFQLPAQSSHGQKRGNNGSKTICY